MPAPRRVLPPKRPEDFVVDGKLVRGPDGFVFVGEGRVVRPDENVDEAPATDLAADGGCTWGRSHASRHGKHSLRSELNREDAREAQRRILEHPEWRRPLIEREARAAETEAAVARMRSRETQLLVELEEWEAKAESSPRPGRRVRILVWERVGS